MNLKNKKIIIASKNPNKIKEIKDIFKNAKINFTSLLEVDVIDEIKETGNSFLENAFIKAHTVAAKFQLPTIADDSGLIVPILNEAPGIYSARFAGENATSQQNNQKLITELKKRNILNTPAYFQSVMVYYDQEENISTSGIGKIHGEIITHLRGKSGFGYDPLFIPQGHKKTFAEMNSDEKNKISHRKQALNNLVKKMVTIYKINPK